MIGNRLRLVVILASMILLVPVIAIAQAADWQKGIWHEPQVRYLLADMSLGGDVELYRKYAMAEEKDPDSREAIRLWDAGARVVNISDFERKRLNNEFGKDGKVMRIVFRGSARTISGNEVLLTSDTALEQHVIRKVLAALTLGVPATEFERQRRDRSVTEAMRRWNCGVRATNANWFELVCKGDSGMVVYRGTDRSIDGSQVRLNSDPVYSEANVRYFLADIFLGGSRAFYVRAAQAAHEVACQEAVARYDTGVTIANLEELVRKKVNGIVLITRKGSNERIRGVDVRLSTD
ncbi:MAG: hypothetical protein ACLP9L_17845 [Thermoguttaceae bacterium]